MIRIITLMMIFYVSLPICLSAQNRRISEAAVNIEDLFVEANREKVLGRFSQAIEKFEKVLELDKTNDAAAYELARIYDSNNDLEKAFKNANLAIALDKKNKWYQMFLADLYEKTGKDTEAANIYKTLTESQGFDENLYYQWAYYLVRAGDVEKALKVYEQLEKKVGVQEELVRRKHAIYLAMGDNKKAGKELQKLANANPENVDYQKLLAVFYEQMGDMEAAKAAYQKVLLLEPNDSQANLALLSDKKANSDVLYLNSLKSLFAKPEVDIDSKIKELIPYVNKVAETNDPALSNAALELADILEKTHPNEAKSYALYGDLLYHSGKPNEALQKYLQTIKLNKNVYAVWEQIAYIYLENGNDKELLTVTDQIIELYPNQPVPFLLNALANDHQKNYDDAISSLEQAALMAGKNPVLKAEIFAQLSLEYSNKGQYEKAKGIAQKAIDSPQCQSAFAWALAKSNDPNGAKEWFEKALNNKGDSIPFVLEKYGDWLYASGETDKAVSFWKKARENGNKLPQLEKKIAERKIVE